MRPGLLIIAGIAAAAAIAVTPIAARAEPPVPAQQDQNVFVLGGPFQHEWVWETAAFWRDHYEKNFFAGVGYQNFVYHSDFGLKAGLEVGLGIRSGAKSSAELWAGLVARYDGLHIGDLNIAPSVTAGLSAVTGTIGVESERAEDIGQAVPVLFYLGPEISLSHADNPNVELTARIQHRSGGYGAIAPIDGSNAATVGMRFNF
jgi:hypothetical protein